MTEQEKTAIAEGVHRGQEGACVMLCFGVNRVLSWAYRADDTGGVAIVLIGSTGEKSHKQQKPPTLLEAMELANAVLMMPTTDDLRAFGRYLTDMADGLDEMRSTDTDQTETTP